MSWKISTAKVFIVIPTYNEKENLPKLVKEIFSLHIPETYILVVDDNSPDGTGQLAEDLGRINHGRVQVIHRPGKMGLGTAYIEGFQRALKEGAEAIIQMDADFSHPTEKIPALLSALENCDVAIGSRYIPGGSVDIHWPAWRKFLSAFGNVYARIILRLSMRDVTGGFKAWRRATLLRMPLEKIRSNGYVFQIEMAYIFRRLGFNFIEIPIYFADRVLGNSKMSFRIQVEAAIRVWLLIPMYHNLKAIK